eukprot:tig00000073_g1707.t1
MLDHISILSKGGVVLWSKSEERLKGEPINNLIRTVLLEERGGQSSHNVDSYTLKWTLANELDLIFVVVYQRILQLFYVDELLERVKHQFTSLYRDRIISKSIDKFAFDEAFKRIYAECEERADDNKRPRAQQQFQPAARGKTAGTSTKKTLESAEDDSEASGKEKVSAKGGAAGKAAGKSGQNGSAPAKNASPSPVSNDKVPAKSDTDTTADESQDQIRANIEKLKAGKLPPRAVGAKKKEKKEDPFLAAILGGKKGAKPAAEEPTKKAKVARKWDGQVSREEASALDFSKNQEATGDESGDGLNAKTDEYFKKGPMQLEDEESSEEETEEEEAAAAAGAANGSAPSGEPKKRSFFTSMLRTITGNKVLEAEDLAPVLLSFRQRLMEKNVAVEIADKLCESVSASLLGRKISSFATVSATVKKALEEAITRILTPKRSTDILAEVLAAKAQRRPYTIVFMGVNGVGKSTNLAKVCYWLQSNGVNCMIAACDTFRSGAVEQLKVHSRKLGVPLFERGYGKDAAAIAQSAIASAKESGVDCVLVDTAGRMQDNEPLMRALAKLVHQNKPDLILFVGEALVGNDAVDQLTKFNQSLTDFAPDPSAPPRLVDGIVLTKFDTIDDKVGAAISMVYTTGQPIMFVGCGQTYHDLRKLNNRTIIRALLR